MRRLDRDNRLRPVALQSTEAEALLPEMSPDKRMDSWHLVMPDGRVWSGGAAVDPLVQILGRPRLLGAFARRFPHATEAGYRWVADHRSWLGRFLSA